MGQASNSPWARTANDGPLLSSLERGSHYSASGYSNCESRRVRVTRSAVEKARQSAALPPDFPSPPFPSLLTGPPQDQGNLGNSVYISLSLASHCCAQQIGVHRMVGSNCPDYLSTWGTSKYS